MRQCGDVWDVKRRGVVCGFVYSMFLDIVFRYSALYVFREIDMLFEGR